MIKCILLIVNCLISLEVMGCNIKLESKGSSSTDIELGDYNFLSGLSFSQGFIVSCGNNKRFTIHINTRNNCQLRQSRARIPYYIFYNSTGKELCSQTLVNISNQKAFNLNFVVPPIKVPPQAGNYYDTVEVIATF